MFNLINQHHKIAKGILITITITFIVWGIGNYLTMNHDDNYLVKIGDLF